MTRVKILLGHTGSGKTEISINLAVAEALLGKNVVIIDLDIVNPYFCIRDIKEKLENKYKIKVISSHSSLSNAELMVLPGEVITYLVNGDYEVILDIGGGGEGAKVLAQYIKYLNEDNYEAYFVVNAFRSETIEVKEIINYLNKLEKVSGIKVTGIINNSHLLFETTSEEIQSAEIKINTIANEVSIPVKYTVINKGLTNINTNSLVNKVLLIDSFFKPY